jgi:hypothetical protein
MAWTALSFAYGSKLTSTQMTQLFDNFTAMGSGSANAPKVSRYALELYTAGSYQILSAVNTAYTQANSMTKVREVMLGRGGTISIEYMMMISSGGRSQVYRNGAAVGTERISVGGSTGYNSYYVEAVGSWSPGDLLQIYAASPNSAYQCFINSFNLRVANPLDPVLIS